MSLRGHLVTIGALVRRRRRPPRAPHSRPWSALVEDPVVGALSLTGRLTEVEPGRDLVVIVHGLGGHSERDYVLEAAAAAAAAGLSSLRINLRGADRRGQDFYHAGLTADLEAVLVSPELARFERLSLLGFSLGGHTVLRFAVESDDSRFVAAAAICAPLDLAAAARAIDRPGCWLYRRYVLASLFEIYAAVAARRAVPTPVEKVRRVRKIRQYDDLVVAPRYGFRCAEEYYATQSVGPRLGGLRRPALLLLAAEDPMIPPECVLPFLSASTPQLQFLRVPGAGHLAFPAAFHLGVRAPAGLAPQVLGWLRFQGRGGHRTD
ncbi:MAG: alpha/beta fold hydrolase [Thermoanaerobaculia bacterium]